MNDADAHDDESPADTRSRHNLLDTPSIEAGTTTNERDTRKYYTKQRADELVRDDKEEEAKV